MFPFLPLARNPADSSKFCIVEILNGGHIGHPPGDEQPADRGSRKTGGRDDFAARECASVEYFVDDGNSATSAYSGARCARARRATASGYPTMATEREFVKPTRPW